MDCSSKSPSVFKSDLNLGQISVWLAPFPPSCRVQDQLSLRYGSVRNLLLKHHPNGIWDLGIWIFGISKFGIWNFGLWTFWIWKFRIWKFLIWKFRIWNFEIWKFGIWKFGIWWFCKCTAHALLPCQQSKMRLI